MQVIVLGAVRGMGVSPNLAGYALTVPDLGTDDVIDSDADPITGETPLVGPLFLSADAGRWSAGQRLLGPCVPPDEPIFISNIRPIAGTGDVVLDFQDNQPADVTGYNVYRSPNPATPPANWSSTDATMNGSRVSSLAT